MYSNIMSAQNDAAATTAGQSITQQYSDNYSEIYNDTIDKLNELVDLAISINAIKNAPEPVDAAISNNETNINDEPARVAQNINIRKSHYENQAIQYLYNWNKLLHYIYYFFAISLVISLFLSPNSFSIFAQVVVAIAVLLYPYYSVNIVKHAMKFYRDIRSLLPINVYTNYSDQHNYFSPNSVIP
jgi:hypothetical protein